VNVFFDLHEFEKPIVCSTFPMRPTFCSDKMDDVDRIHWCSQ